MKRNLFVIAMTIAALTIALGHGAASAQPRPQSNDEEALKTLVKECADAIVHADLPTLEKFMDENFKGSVENISFNRKMVVAAVKSGDAKVASLTIHEVRVSIRGNSASVTGRSTLSNATYSEKKEFVTDLSGDYEWTDRFVKQRDGSWRVVPSQSKRIKK